jgi:ABC-type nitrate/sulfonate/bicarbonate transport system permease component
LLAGFGFILLPLIALIALSIVSHIAFPIVIAGLLASFLRLLVAFLIAVVLAWVLVVWLIRGRTESSALAFFDVMQSIPTFTILPLAVYYFGTSEVIIILFLVITIIWPIIFSIVSALKQAERSWGEAVIMTRISGMDYMRYYLLPLTAPGIVTGAIIGLGDGWEALIATELLLHVRLGLGPFFERFSSNPPMTLFGVLVFLCIIFTINKFVWLPLLERSHHLIEE